MIQREILATNELAKTALDQFEAAESIVDPVAEGHLDGAFEILDEDTPTAPGLAKKVDTLDEQTEAVLALIDALVYVDTGEQAFWYCHAAYDADHVDVQADVVADEFQDAADGVAEAQDALDVDVEAATAYIDAMATAAECYGDAIAERQADNNDVANSRAEAGADALGDARDALGKRFTAKRDEYSQE